MFVRLIYLGIDCLSPVPIAKYLILRVFCKKRCPALASPNVGIF